MHTYIVDTRIYTCAHCTLTHDHTQMYMYMYLCCLIDIVSIIDLVAINATKQRT